MRIPEDAGERQKFYDELVKKCTNTRRKRFEVNRVLRNYYLFGSPDASGCVYNRIEETVDTLSSFIYAPDSARFSLNLGTTATEDDIHKAPLLVKEVNDQWRSSHTHLIFGLGLEWSLVFGSMIFKTLWQGKAHRSQTYLVEPHQFGVLREDKINLSDQEAFVHCYTTTKSQLENDLDGDPRKERIMAQVGDQASQSEGELYSSGLSRLVLSAGIASLPGSTTPGGAVEDGLTSGASYDYIPEVEAELIDMFELYVWNDAINDYHMVTIASPNIVVYDRKHFGVEGIPSFTKLAPDPKVYDYFWGASFVAKLIGLQDWRSENIEDIRELLRKNVDPPWAVSGVVGIAEEKLRALRSRGGITNLGQTGKADKHPPTIPSEAFKIEDSIDGMYDSAAGVSHVMQGKGASGVRSKGQADLLARLGSARPKKRALMVEETAADLATLILRYVQDHSTQRYQIKPSGMLRNPFKKPLTFIAEQFTKDYEVVVDAHSSSPVFMEDRKNDAMTLFEAGAIDRDTLLEMFDPPNIQVLQEKLKGLEDQRKKQAALEAAAEGAKQK